MYQTSSQYVISSGCAINHHMIYAKNYTCLQVDMPDVTITDFVVYDLLHTANGMVCIPYARQRKLWTDLVHTSTERGKN